MKVIENDKEPKSNYILKPCLQSHAKARHWYKGATKKWRNVTPWIHSCIFGIIGIIVGATKYEKQTCSFPFAKLSNGALKKVKRGGEQMAGQYIVNHNWKVYTVKATVWKDKGRVGDVQNRQMEDTKDHTIGTTCSPATKEK